MAISKKDTLGSIIQDYPEVAPVLSKAGLHCIGCHVSAYESFEDGCRVHGLTDKEIDGLVKDANKKIKEVDALPKVSFSKKALVEIEKRKKKTKGKYIRIVRNYDGFDFDSTKEKVKGEIVISKVGILADKQIERILRGIEIDYDDKVKDFTANKKK